MSEQRIYKGGIGANVRAIELSQFQLPMELKVSGQPLPVRNDQCKALIPVSTSEIVEASEDIIEGDVTVVEPSPFPYFQINPLDCPKGTLVDVVA